MSRESHGEILLIAIVLSIVVHFGTMYYARPKVMAHVVSDSVRTTRREAMHVTTTKARPAPVRADAMPEVDALKDEPAAESVRDVPMAPAPETDIATAREVVPIALADVPDSPRPAFEVPHLNVRTLSSERSAYKIVLPPPDLGRPKVTALSKAPDAAPPAPVASIAAKPPVPQVGNVTEPDFGTKIVPVSLDVGPDGQKVEKAFKPVEEVREKVDEKLVEKEKDAVKGLLDVSRAEELKKFVNVAISKTTSGNWTYFKMAFSPRNDLPVISKDVVLLIDASGSIGKDRIRSIRDAAKGILRSCTNSGDRFNLVAFRDKYTYAFRRWQDCSQASFDLADKWLSNVAAHGRTDVFATIRSVLTLPRDPTRPLIALVITDGDANYGVSETSQILSQFTALNDGLISVYMYGVKGSANRELIDILTRGNRGESFVYDGWRWSAGSGIEKLGERFRDPVLSDLRVLFASGTKAEVYPRLLKNLYRGETLEVFGRIASTAKEIAFSVRGLNGKDPFEGFFKLSLETAGQDSSIGDRWKSEHQIDMKLR